MESALLWMMPLAVALDLLSGSDAAMRARCLLPGCGNGRLPHPVQLIGLWLNLLEPRLRALAPRLERTEGFLPDVLCDGEVRAGFLGLVFTVVLTAAVAAALIRLPFVGLLAAVYLCYAGLALGQLLRAGREALDALERDDVEDARRRIAMLVSRDVSRADRRDLFRSLAETLAENFNDGFVAPLFWLTVGGPAGLWMYKAVSTIDSMWGYRTPAWEGLGKAAARLDDVLAFFPARLSVFLLWVVGQGASVPGAWPGVAVVRRQAAQMASPNAGWPMAAAAWLHGAPMGGPTVYHGEVVDKPRLGPDAAAADRYGDRFGPWDAPRLRSLLRHLLTAGVAATLTALAVLWTLSLVV